MLNKSFLRLICGALIFLLLPLSAYGMFPDVEEDYEYAESIEYLHSKDLLYGDSEAGTYRPLDNINRAEFAAILSRLLSIHTQTLEENLNCFPDVTDQWFAGSVCHAKKFGLVEGYSAGEMAGLYGPAEFLLNAEIIVVLSRMADWKLEEPGIAAEWYEPSWNYAVSHNIIDNQEVGENTSRGLMAEVIFRAAVVKLYGLNIYTKEDGQKFINDNEPIDFFPESN